MNFLSLFKRGLIYKLKKKINIDLDELDHLSLDELFSHYGTDKSEYSNEKQNKTHGFSKYYVKHLDFFKKKNIKILEIGSFSGASAAAFSKYFPKSEIFCLDINISNFKYHSNKIHVFGLNSSSQKMVLNFFQKINLQKSFKYFDIIIDDGSHKLSDQLKTLNIFYKYLANGGFYVIEDYKFSNYFKHLNDINEPFINKILNKLERKEDIKSNLIDTQTLNLLRRNLKTFYKYKGAKDISDILFLERLN